LQSARWQGAVHSMKDAVGIQMSSDAIYTMGSSHIRLLPYDLHTIGGLMELLANQFQPSFLYIHPMTGNTHCGVAANEAPQT
jgi:hypothetical protein